MSKTTIETDPETGVTTTTVENDDGTSSASSIDAEGYGRFGADNDGDGSEDEVHIETEGSTIDIASDEQGRDVVAEHHEGDVATEVGHSEDGVKTFDSYGADGSSEGTISADLDGDGVTDYLEGSDGTTVVTEPDGSTVTYNPDGSAVGRDVDLETGETQTQTTGSDGSVTTVTTDGEGNEVLASGEIDVGGFGTSYTGEAGEDPLVVQAVDAVENEWDSLFTSDEPEAAAEEEPVQEEVYEAPEEEIYEEPADEGW